MDIIVVEGTHDEAKIKLCYPNASCVVTNGSEISNDTINCIKKLAESNNIIIFTDPDSPGERIRKIITEAVPNAKQAFLKKNKCISKNNKKVGIEHADVLDIKESLEKIFDSSYKETISNKDLYSLGLNGNSDSAILRDKISDYLNIGRPNCKTFLKRINMLGLTKKELEEIICQVK